MGLLPCIDLQTRIDGRVAQLFFNPDELIVFGNTVRPASRTGLDLSGIGGDSNVRYGGVFRLTGAMADHAVYPARLAISIASSVSVNVPIWFTLMRMEFATPSRSLLQERRVGHKHVITDDLYFLPEGVGHRLPSIPVVLCHAVFDRHDGYCFTSSHSTGPSDRGSSRICWILEDILPILEELARCRIESKKDIFSGCVVCFRNRFRG